jgi:hypothetical protein
MFSIIRPLTPTQIVARLNGAALTPATLAASGKISTTSTAEDSIETAGGINANGGTAATGTTATQIILSGGRARIGTDLIVDGTGAGSITAAGGAQIAGSAPGTPSAGQVLIGGGRIRLTSDIFMEGSELNFCGGIGLTDGVSEPGAVSGLARIYVDSADGDLKIKFGDGTVKTIVTDS